MADRLRGRARRDDDRGAILVLGATMLTALVITTALVVDLGLTRGARRSNQSVADLSALAAGNALGADPAPDGRNGCFDAIAYLKANLTAAPSGLAVPCGSLPASCGPATVPVTVTDGGTAGGWTVEVTYPVSDAQILDADVAAGNSLRLDDGVPCERLEVSVERTIDSIFAGILGRSSFSIDASAVVRQVQAGDRRVPSLWLLDPYGCPTLDVQGGSHVTVGTATTPGLITLDSDGSACTGNTVTIDVGGSGSSIQAIPLVSTPSAAISLVAMDRTQVDCTTGNPHACDPSDVSGGTLSPQPIRRANRATRAPVDHTYNCTTGYPQYHGIDIADCTAGTDPYIDQLRTAVGASGLPFGFQRWSDTYGCNNPTTPVTGLDGNWLVDCATFRVSSETITFNGGNVIFDGEIVMTGGVLELNAANPTAALPVSCTVAVIGCVSTSASTAAWAYMRDGNIRMTGGALVANHTMIYQHSGYFSIAGGSPPVWSAPTDGPFSGLSVWSELSSNKFSINGGASMQLEGTFFTPEANTFSISGGAPVVPQQAQFVSYRLSVSGGASLTLSPNPNNAVTLPADAPLLIR